MRENRETPLLQAAIRIGAAFVVATVYLRHLLPVSDISFFITLCKSKPVQPLDSRSLGLRGLPRCYEDFARHP